MEQKKHIQRNRNEILLGTRQNTIKSFPHILAGGKLKTGVLCHKTPPNTKPHKYETNIFENNNLKHRKLKRPANWNRNRLC